MSKRNLGSSFDKFLEENDLLEEVTAVAVKRVIAHQKAALSLPASAALAHPCASDAGEAIKNPAPVKK